MQKYCISLFCSRAVAIFKIQLYYQIQTPQGSRVTGNTPILSLELRLYINCLSDYRKGSLICFKNFCFETLN